MGLESDSCVVCLGPLSAGSVNGVCPVCLRTAPVREPGGDTVRPAGTVGPGARVRAAAAEPDLPLPPSPPGLVLVRRLGVGGMGAVYLAVDAATRRFVAVKLLHTPGDRGTLDRFQAEVRALAELAHPHIVAVFAADLRHHTPYCTMEFVPGGTLARFVAATGPLAPRAAAATVAPLARAAAAAHRKGIVHRDIKPGNVLLGVESGGGPAGPFGPDVWVPKLSDFGLAKRTDRDEGLTVGCATLGTPGFMAPEQATGAPVSARTDVYGLGATLYHALTGRAPFEGADPAAVAARVQADDPPRVRLLRPAVPVELEAVAHKCLEKDPAARYASAEELAADLDRFAAGEPVAAKPLTRLRRAARAVGRNRRRLARAAVAAVVVAAALAVGAAWNGPRAERAAAPDPLDAMRADLAAGKEVTLVGATGEPRWHRWVRGPAAFGPARGRHDACSFQTMDLSMLDLCPDPGTDRYRVRAEICQLDVSGRAPGGQLPTGGNYVVGLYFGRQTAAGAGAWRSEVAFLIDYTELAIPGPRHATASRLALPHAADRRPGAGFVAAGSVPFAPTKSLPGAWRTIAVEVGPAEIRARWIDADGDRAFPLTPDAAGGAVFARRHDALDRVAPENGIVYPGWSPRGAIGVWAYQSAVAVRNVTVTPLK